MKTSRKRLYQVSIIVVVAASLLIGFFVWRQRANQPMLIGREQAIQNAIQACPAYGLQLVGQPTEFQAELTTWGMYNTDSERPVWVVTVKGRWLLVGGPQPDPASNPEPSYWDECTITIDAQTGESLSLPIE